MGRIVKTIILSVALLVSAPLFAQFDLSVVGAGAGLGGTSVALEDADAAIENAAGLALVESRWIGLSLQQLPKVEGMNQAAISLASPLPFGGMGLGMVHYGDAEYHEERISLAYGLPVGEHVALGVALHYLHSGTSDPYYDPLNRATFTIGLRYSLSQRMTVGFRAYNPVAVIGETEQAVRIPALFNMGVSCWLTSELMAVAEVEKSSFYPARLRTGLQYKFLEDYMVRVGLCTAPVVYTFGVGVQKTHIGGDVAVQVHNVLGLLPQLALHYRF